MQWLRHSPAPRPWSWSWDTPSSHLDSSCSRTKALQQNTSAKKCPACYTRGWSGIRRWLEAGERLEQGHEALKTWAPEPPAPGRAAGTANLLTQAQARGVLGYPALDAASSRRKGEETTHPQHHCSPTWKGRGEIQCAPHLVAQLKSCRTFRFGRGYYMTAAFVEYVGSTSCVHLSHCSLDVAALGCLTEHSPHMTGVWECLAHHTQKTHLRGADFRVSYNIFT